MGTEAEQPAAASKRRRTSANAPVATTIAICSLSVTRISACGINEHHHKEHAAGQADGLHDDAADAIILVPRILISMI